MAKDYGSVDSEALAEDPPRPAPPTPRIWAGVVVMVVALAGAKAYAKTGTTLRGVPMASLGTTAAGGKCSPNRGECATRPDGKRIMACRGPKNGHTCQKGDPGSLCGSTEDCMTPRDLGRPVCRKNVCESGQPGSKAGEPGARCGGPSDCVKPSFANAVQGICRHDYCWGGRVGDSCGNGPADCASGICDPKEDNGIHRCCPPDGCPDKWTGY